MITAPDGSQATADADATRLLYSRIEPGGDNCECAGCLNWRAAWNVERLDSDLATACQTCGIDPSKAFETTALYANDTVFYSAELPFSGELIGEGQGGTEVFRWGFGRPSGSADLGPGIVCISIVVAVPWVLDEPNPYLGK